MRLDRRDLLPFAHSLTLISILALNATLALYFPQFCLLTVPLTAFALSCAMSAVHECAHNTYFSSPLMNRLTGRLWASANLLHFSLYRRDHMIHHVHIGTERDTEARFHIASRVQLLKAILLNPHVSGQWHDALLALIKGRGIFRRDAILLLGVAAGIFIAAAFYPYQTALIHVLPFALSTVVDNVINIPEHATFAPEQPQGTPLTRSIKTGRLVSFLFYWSNLHLEHHFPKGNYPAAAPPSRSETYWSFYRLRLSKDYYQPAGANLAGAF
jgi:fatty acid desaturase